MVAAQTSKAPEHLDSTLAHATDATHACIKEDLWPALFAAP